ncbi:hypothetical protein QVD17_31001 [Tagetes erecta]|uniref:WRKY domain-containing protein n=1 Tax=Tagetes erecta TaxID=13708 RepID=A0AAD8K6P0_TARER|nr:hypothetical protein QVD17_31001 [Tagetes erecta]
MLLLFLSDQNSAIVNSDHHTTTRGDVSTTRKPPQLHTSTTSQFHKPKVKASFIHTLSQKVNHLKMDDEWDLHAVVRSCNTASTDATLPSQKNATTTNDEDQNNDFDVTGSVACRNVVNPFSYSTSRENPSEGLEEVYKEGCSQPVTTTTNITAPISVGDEQFEMLNASDSNYTEAPSRKRKSQQKKMVVELTQEELCSDTWAWRKYGQKPIKGSPFPRNYYKCSTTKACGARKQVEQSHTDPTIFIVSYSGEHIHPPPTHRSPLAGSTRSTKSTIPNIPAVSDDTTHSRSTYGGGDDSKDAH